MDELITNAFELSNVIQKQLDKTVKVNVLRNGKEEDLDLKLDPIELQRPEGQGPIYITSNFLG